MSDTELSRVGPLQLIHHDGGAAEMEVLDLNLSPKREVDDDDQRKGSGIHRKFSLD